MTDRCPWIAPLDYGPRGTCGARWGYCIDALDEALELARTGRASGLALWLRYPDPQAVLALADRRARRRGWLDELGAPTPLTVEWLEAEYSPLGEAS